MNYKNLRKSLLLLIVFFQSSLPLAQQRPNIVLIMADDMGYSDLGCYGSEIPTPNLDALAAKGLRFSQFYNTARCCPTRASLLTGLFPHQTGVGHMTEEPGNTNSENWGTEGYEGHINNKCITIAEALKPAGYHTYMTGKWHLGLQLQETWPLQRGFEKYYGILAGAANYFKPQGGRGLYYMNTKLDPPPPPYYTTDAFADSAVAFVRSQKDGKPFFLYLAFNAPHWPLNAKEEDIKKFEGMYDKGWDVIRLSRYEKQVKLGLIEKSTPLSVRDTSARAWADLSADERKEVAYRMAVYAAQVSCMDQNIGKLIAELKRKKQLDNTIIIFLSDNGACPEPYKELGGGNFADINSEKYGVVSYGEGWANASNTPYRKWKRELEEGGMRAPFIVHWPNGIQKKDENSFRRSPAYLIDIMPTFLQLAKTSYPSKRLTTTIHPLEGKSMVPLFMQGEQNLHDFMFWEHEGNQAIRKGNWKAVKDNGRKDWELFDLSTDKVEEHNVALKNPAILKELTTKWEEWANSHYVLPKRNNTSSK